MRTDFAITNRDNLAVFQKVGTNRADHGSGTEPAGFDDLAFFDLLEKITKGDPFMAGLQNTTFGKFQNGQ